MGLTFRISVQTLGWFKGVKTKLIDMNVASDLGASLGVFAVVEGNNYGKRIIRTQSLTSRETLSEIERFLL